MKLIKRLICLILAMLVCLSLGACASTEDKAFAEAAEYMRTGNYAAAVQAFSTLERYSSIPQHHFEEAARVTEQIAQWKQEHPNSLVFGAVSDIHINLADEQYTAWSQATARHAAFALETVGVLTDCDFVVNLGDNCWENGIDTPVAREAAAYAINTLNASFTRLEAYHIPGNHDKSDNTQGQFDLIGANNFYNDPAPTRIRGYGYRDYPAMNVRVLFLNNVDYLNISGGYGMSYEQKDWLMRSLDLSEKPDADQWQILIISHFPVDFNYGNYNIYPDLQAILTGYVRGDRVTIPVEPAYCLNEDPSGYPCYSQGFLRYDYEGRNSAKIIANIHGHVHTNAAGVMGSHGLLRITTPNASPFLDKTESYPEEGSYSISSEEAQSLVKVENSPRDTSVTFYCIDLESEEIYAFGYGANTDRFFSYKEIKVFNVYYALEGTSVYPRVETVMERGSLDLNLNCSGDASLLYVSVAMGGEDITDSCYANGKIHIPQVTDNVIIEAGAGDLSTLTNYFDPTAPDFEDFVRFTSDGNTTEGSGYCSGFIPVTAGDVIRCYCPAGNYETDEVGNNIRCIIVYNEAKKAITCLYPGETDGYLFGGLGFVYTITEEDAAYVRVSGHLAGTYDSFIVTMNHEILTLS